DAINKERCYDRFWGGAFYKLGRIASVSIVRGPDRVDVWSDKLEHLRGRFVTHFVIKSNRGKTFVDVSESYNARVFPQMVAKLRTPDRIELPAATDCKPTKAKDSPKTRLIQEIAADELAGLDALAHRGRTKSIVIANVDEAYPESLVYVPATDELFTVRIPPGTSYVYREDGPYLFGQVVDKVNVAWVRPKML